jgi:predicted NAD/FAD-dependent oxidoreductase
MYVFEEPLALGFDGAFLADGPVSWMARNSSKPGRPLAESWVVHAGPEWTRKHQSSDREAMARTLLKVVEERFGPLPGVAFQRAHRWGFAFAAEPVPGGALYDPELGLGACGDWCQGGRVEGALLSGIAVAGRILGQAPAAPANPLGEESPGQPRLDV